ncbi:MAG TPA: hypothetical protein P5233_03520 [Candidatus Paceibacterota bacterium]|nr:hypothetical protein [Candidatus Paceibacterota bacterium]
MKTNTLCSFLLSGALFVLFPAPSVTAQTLAYDATVDFSVTKGNPNGVWSYGWMPSGFGPLNLFTTALNPGNGNPQWAGWYYDNSPTIWRNLGPLAYGVPTGWLSLHPGPGQEPAVLRWTAPTSGSVKLEGQFLPGDGGTMQVAVRLNGQPWWSDSDAGTFALHTNVQAGATIDFAVYGGYWYGNTPLAVTISIPALRLDLARDGTTNIVTFTPPAEGTYVLQFTDSLAPPIPWTDLSTNSLAADQFFRFVHSPASSLGFYRCRRD